MPIPPAKLFTELQEINQRPAPWERYTAGLLWTDPWVSGQMLVLHLNQSNEAASRDGAFISRSVAWMIRHFGLGPGKAVADFGCGPGLYSNRLAASGARVLGVDFSASSIAHARQEADLQGLATEYVRQNYLEFASAERFDLITLIYCDYCALSPQQRGRLLDIFHGLLKPGGALLFDVFSLGRLARLSQSATYEFCPGEGFWAQQPHYVFQNSFLYPEQNLALDKYTIVSQEETRLVFNWLEHFSLEGLQGELAGHGLVLRQPLGSVAGDPFNPAADQFAVIAEAA